jgi:hypothetical protein
MVLQTIRLMVTGCFYVLTSGLQLRCAGVCELPLVAMLRVCFRDWSRYRVEETHFNDYNQMSIQLVVKFVISNGEKRTLLPWRQLRR